MRLTAAIASTFAVAGFVAAPVAGHATICEGVADVASVLPFSSELDAPANVTAWVGEAWTDTAVALELRRAIAPYLTVETVETRIVAGRDEVTILSVLEPLPVSAYKVFAVQESGAEYELTVFATDEGADTTPPAVPGTDGFEAAWETGETPECGTFADGRIYVPFTGSVMVLDIDDDDDGVPDEPPGDDDDSADGDDLPLVLDPDALEGTVDAFVFDQHHPDYFAVGDTPCLDNWPGARPGDSTRIRFGAFDLAGNFSGWGEWHDLEIPREIERDPAGDGPPEDDGGGCSVAAHARARGVFPTVAIVALVAVRRRWHTPPP